METLVYCAINVDYPQAILTINNLFASYQPLFPFSNALTPEFYHKTLFDGSLMIIKLKERYNYSAALKISDYRIHSIAFLKDFTKNIKEYFREKNLEKFSNIDNFIDQIEDFKDHSSTFYTTYEDQNGIKIPGRPYRELEDLIYSKQHNFFPVGPKLFPYTNILTLADYSSYIGGGIGGKLMDILNDPSHLVSITKTDLYASATDQEKERYRDLKVRQLDNSKPFIDQNITEKYDLVFMYKGLCQCDEELTCGGIDVKNPKELSKFLDNVASILDSTKPHTIAWLTGFTFYDFELNCGVIQDFNEQYLGIFVANSMRDIAGTCRGISIRCIATE